MTRVLEWCTMLLYLRLVLVVVVVVVILTGCNNLLVAYASTSTTPVISVAIMVVRHRIHTHVVLHEILPQYYCQ